MKCRVKSVQAWRKIASFVGMEESVGKTYYSREFVQINSQNFKRLEVPIIEQIEVPIKREKGSKLSNEDFRLWIQGKLPDTELKERQRFFKRIKYVNMGLIKGYKRSGSGLGLNDLTSVHDNAASRARYLMETSPKSLREPIMEKFLKVHGKFLSTLGIPWFIPEWLGGVGLPEVGKFKASDLQKRTAIIILRDWEIDHPITMHEQGEWKTRVLALKNMTKDIYTTTDKNFSGVEMFNREIGKLCLNVLFDSNVSMDDLLQTVSGMSKKAINHNKKLWKKATLKYLKQPKQVSQSPEEIDLNFIPRYDSLLPGPYIRNVSGSKRKIEITTELNKEKEKEFEEDY
jgi:hypothetical protein